MRVLSCWLYYSLCVLSLFLILCVAKPCVLNSCVLIKKRVQKKNISFIPGGPKNTHHLVSDRNTRHTLFILFLFFPFVFSFLFFFFSFLFLFFSFSCFSFLVFPFLFFLSCFYSLVFSFLFFLFLLSCFYFLVFTFLFLLSCFYFLFFLPFLFYLFSFFLYILFTLSMVTCFLLFIADISNSLWNDGRHLPMFHQIPPLSKGFNFKFLRNFIIIFRSSSCCSISSFFMLISHYNKRIFTFILPTDYEYLGKHYNSLRLALNFLFFHSIFSITNFRKDDEDFYCLTSEIKWTIHKHLTLSRYQRH